METDDRAAVLIPLGDFLTAEEPVWVWDAEACRILWANQAGRAFWGEPSLDALRERRFSVRNKAVARMGRLARETGGEREWIETLTLPAAAGPQAVKCIMQLLHVAGGRPGLIVKAVGCTNGRDRPAPKPPAAAKHNASDHAALKAIAAQMKTATPAENGRARTQSRASRVKPEAKKPATAATQRTTQADTAAHPLPDDLVLALRELCHELRNPLTVILGFSERIHTGAVRNPDKVKSYAGNIMDSAQLAMEILADFSSRYLRPGAGVAAPEPVAVGPVIARCQQLIAPLAAQAGLKVFRSVGGYLPPLQIAERVLKQILLNVLINAVRHQKTGGMVRITAKRRKDGATRITVADDGIGMTKKEIKLIMRGAPRPVPVVPEPGKSGLGLLLVKRLVEAEGGTFGIESTRYKGTTVEISFPAVASVHP